jgi:hypothetical protein
MPKTVAELIETAGVIGGTQPVVLVEIRDIRHLGPQPPLCLGPGASRRFDLAEVASERELPLVVELLIAEDEHRVAVDRIRDRAYRGCSEREPGIDTGYLADE